MTDKYDEPSFDKDEVNILDIVGGLWRQRSLIFFTAIIVTFISVVYAFTAKSIYEARLVVLPPTESDIAQLNMGRDRASELQPLNTKEVYDAYLQALQSEQLRQEFFREVYLPSLSEVSSKESQDKLYAELYKNLRIGALGPNFPGQYYITARSGSPESASEWVEKYAELAGDRTKNAIIKDVKAEATIKAINLEQSISTSRQSARKQRDDQITLLTDALEVANSIGLEKPPIISNSLSNEVSAGMEGELIYMRGSKALKKEIENLKARSSDDPFIRDLRIKEAQVGFYRSLSFDKSHIGVYRQDGRVQLSSGPVKPNKTLIIMFGVIVGLLLGVFISFLQEARMRTMS